MFCARALPECMTFDDFILQDTLSRYAIKIKIRYKIVMVYRLKKTYQIGFESANINSYLNLMYTSLSHKIFSNTKYLGIDSLCFGPTFSKENFDKKASG